MKKNTSIRLAVKNSKQQIINKSSKRGIQTGVFRSRLFEEENGNNDIEDFEIFMEQIEHVFHHEVEGNFSGFYYDELLPLMKKELRRREAVLEGL